MVLSNSSNASARRTVRHAANVVALSPLATACPLIVSWFALVLATACSSSGNGVEASGGSGYTVSGSQGGTNGYVNGTGTNNSNGAAAGVVPGCVIGSQGCYCDTIGGCATGLTCKSSLCCDSNSGSCTQSTVSTGTSTSNGTSTYTSVSTGTSTGTNTNTNVSTGTCTPGVIGTLVTDCGYTFASSNPLTSVEFNESEVLVGIVPTGGSYATVRVFYGDEHALTLGIRNVTVKAASGTTSTDYPVSPMSTNPGAATFPQTGSNVLFGAQAGLDQSLRPMWPALFITDITSDPNGHLGDWQYGGRPYNPNAVYGTWKAAVRTVDTTVTPNTVTITPDADPTKNNWSLETGADAVPSTFKKNEGYGAEVVWNLALIPGHSYRVQAMVHDGDQNKVGGDSGEACVDFCAGGDNSPPDGGTGIPPGGSTPLCDEGSDVCGPGGIDPSACPTDNLCINGCCTWSQNLTPIIY